MGGRTWLSRPGLPLPLLLLLLLPGAAGFAPSLDGDFTFTLPAGLKECFYQPMPHKASLEIEYQVSDGCGGRGLLASFLHQPRCLPRPRALPRPNSTEAARPRGGGGGGGGRPGLVLRAGAGPAGSVGARRDPGRESVGPGRAWPSLPSSRSEPALLASWARLPVAQLRPRGFHHCSGSYTLFFVIGRALDPVCESAFHPLASPTALAAVFLLLLLAD